MLFNYQINSVGLGVVVLNHIYGIRNSGCEEIKKITMIYKEYSKPIDQLSVIRIIISDSN